MANRGTCSIEGCGERHHGHGWCARHYQLWRNHGDPLKRLRPANGEVLAYFRKVVLADERGESDPCLIWPHSCDSKGYAQLWYDGRLQGVPRLVCEERHGPPPTPDHDAAHSCGRGAHACVTKSHLDWKTRAGNEADKLIHGTSNRGERCGTAKLTEPEVREIMALKGTMTQRAIGEMFGVDGETVGNIHRQERWAWLTTAMTTPAEIEPKAVSFERKAQGNG